MKPAFFIRSLSLAALFLVAAAIPARLQAQTAVQYTASTGETFTLYAYEGSTNVLLVPAGSYETTVLTRMLKQMAYIWAHYAAVTGRQPTPYKTYNGKPVLAAIDTQKLGGAAMGYLGSTGIEFGKARFDQWYASCATVFWDSDFTYAYEMGRNFYFDYEKKLPALDLGIENWPRVFNFVVREPAQFAWWESQKFEGFRLTETNYDYNEIVQYATDYVLDSSATFESVFVAKTFHASSRGRNAGGFIFEGLLCLLNEEFGSVFTNAFWQRLAELPDATSVQTGLDNMALAASRAVNQDLTLVFESQFKFALSAGAKATLKGLPARATLLTLKRTARGLSDGGNLLLDSKFSGSTTGKTEWFVWQIYSPDVMPVINGVNPFTGSPALRMADFSRAAYPDPAYLIVEAFPVTNGASQKLYKISGWMKADSLVLREGVTNPDALFQLGLYSNDISAFNWVYAPRCVKATSTNSGISFGWVYFEQYGGRVAQSDTSNSPSFRITGHVKTGDVWVSDLRVEEIPAPSMGAGLSLIKDVENQAVGLGSTATLTFGVASTSYVDYQWSKNGTQIQNACSGSYCIPSVTTADLAQYSCTARTAAGALLTSKTATLSEAKTAIVTGPIGVAALTGQAFTLSVIATGSNLSYQWYRDGLALAGARSATYSIQDATSLAAGAYTVTVSGGATSLTSSPAIVSVEPTRVSNPLAKLTNLSSRTLVGKSERVQTAGFAIDGTAPKRVLIRASGPALAALGVSGTLTDPVITLYDSASQPIASNDNWDYNTIYPIAHPMGAFDWSKGSNDAALLVTLQPGRYTAIISDKNDGEGVALAEVYEVDYSDTAKQVNISTRSPVGTNDSVQVAGFVISGSGPKTLLIRASGPALSQWISGTLADPVLTIYDSESKPIITNDNWDYSIIQSVAHELGAFDWTKDSKDAALLVTLPPGRYSSIVKGANGGTGIGLIEIYEVNR